MRHFRGAARLDVVGVDGGGESDNEGGDDADSGFCVAWTEGY
jgi:hypothetical protein